MKNLIYVLVAVMCIPFLTYAQDEMLEKTNSTYTAKPKNMWEIGVHVGAAGIAGDVNSGWPNGVGFGLHIRKAISYSFSLRGDFFFSSMKGYDSRFEDAATALRNPAISNLGYGFDGRGFARNYQSNNFSGSLQLLLNAGNLLFHNNNPKWNIYALTGVSLLNNSVTIDALNDGQLYDFNSLDRNSDDYRDLVKDLLDDDFETDAYKGDGGLTLDDDNEWFIAAQFGAGLSRKLTDRVNISLEHIFTVAFTDYLDGYTYRTAVDRSNSGDFINYTNLRINFNLGSKNNRVEPLYWVNPMNTAYQDIADLKARPKLDLTDQDNDGILDMFDEDPNTPEGAPVDVKGVALDSDNDGVLDYKDQELYSPKGYEVDENGVAQIDDPYLTRSEIEALMKGELDKVKMNWWLPMIYFDLNKSEIKPESLPALKQVASVAKNNPNVKILVKGYTDNRADEEYNEVLSYNRTTSAIDYLVQNFNIDRSRFVLQYGGESNPIVKGLPENSRGKKVEDKHAINRRVEFSIAGPNDRAMAPPRNMDDKSNAPKYKGNKNTGY